MTFDCLTSQILFVNIGNLWHLKLFFFVCMGARAENLSYFVCALGGVVEEVFTIFVCKVGD